VHFARLTLVLVLPTIEMQYSYHEATVNRSILARVGRYYYWFYRGIT
jgi:hypothetical protein